jgi:hypothetical protein
MGKTMTFTPRFVSNECKDCPDFIKTDHCISNGEICGVESFEQNLTGIQVLNEDLRQKCVWEQSKQDEEQYSRFFGYIQAVHKECRIAINKDCSEDAQRIAELDSAKTE